MKNLLLIVLSFTALTIELHAWQSSGNVMRDGSIDEQFEYIYDESNRYKQDGKVYRVIETILLTQLQKNVDEAIGDLESELSSAKGQIDKQAKEIDNLKNELAAANTNLTNVTSEKNNMSLFGVIPMKKGAYRTIMWAIVAGLLALLAFFIVSFLRSNVVTRQTKTKLEKTREEFEAYRKKSMEDELVLRRKLQTEINKNLD